MFNIHGLFPFNSLIYSFLNNLFLPFYLLIKIHRSIIVMHKIKKREKNLIKWII
jgi:hypothetical protein